MENKTWQIYKLTFEDGKEYVGLTSKITRGIK